jgi:GTPase SAR1 family protein
VTLDMDARHLAETQPHNDQKLQDWDLPNQEQINKLHQDFRGLRPKSF